MPFTFAHLADVHLGAFRDPTLRDMNIQAFEKACDRCMALDVEFIIIAGDLFEITLPDMSVVDRAAKKLYELKERKISVYVVYGSHDYSPLQTSVIDVLASAGLLKKVVSAEVDDENKIKLNFFKDEKTGALLAGLSARKGGMEKKYYENLDIDSLEEKCGTKIFVFHTAINEIKPEFLAVADGVPLSHFPKKFDYYAGGHIHRRIESDMPGFGKIVYPGHLFGRDYRDLENSANAPAGFYVVKIGEDSTTHTFEPVSVSRIFSLKYCADNKTSSQARDALEEIAEKFEPKNSGMPAVVLLKIAGELSAGKPHEINFESIKNRILARGATSVFVNRNSLTAKEAAQLNVAAGNRQETEERIFAEELAGFQKDAALKSGLLSGNAGTALSRELLACTKAENVGESKTDYESKIVRNALKLLEIGGKHNVS